MNDRQKVYRARVNFDHRGATVWCHFGFVSECGNWVECGDKRWRRTNEWFATQREAKATLAGEVAAMGARLINQAQGLLSEEVMA